MTKEYSFLVTGGMFLGKCADMMVNIHGTSR